MHHFLVSSNSFLFSLKNPFSMSKILISYGFKEEHNITLPPYAKDFEQEYYAMKEWGCNRKQIKAGVKMLKKKNKSL